MNFENPAVRRLALLGTRVAAIASACMLLLSGYVAITGGTPAGAATNNGTVVLDPTSGSSADTFTVSFANGAPLACPGDSATGNYRVQSFVVPSGTSLDGLMFKSTGPAVGQPLIDANGNSLVNGLTDITTGVITQLPGTFTFQYNLPSDFSAGDWLVGIACTQGTGAGMTKTYWSTGITIASDAAGGPAQLTWHTSSPATTTTTTGGSTTTTTDGGSTTTTTADGSTTTTSSTIVVKVGPPLTLSQDTANAGDSVTIQASGWQPSAPVDIYLHSEPILIGTLTADANGDINGAVTIPADTQPGFHTLVALGLDSTGGPMGSSADITIEGSTATTTGGTPSAASPVTTAGQLPFTGSSPLPMIFWAICLLVFGRMAMLVGKRTKVVGDDAP